MSVVVTDLRILRQAAHEISFMPSAPMTATNVQDAIVQANALPGVPSATPVNAGMSPYAVQPMDQVLLVDTSGGPVTITMLAQVGRAGLSLEIKDDTGNASANPITVDMVPGETADGIDPFMIDSNFGRANFTPQAGGYWVK